MAAGCSADDHMLGVRISGFVICLCYFVNKVFRQSFVRRDPADCERHGVAMAGIIEYVDAARRQGLTDDEIPADIDTQWRVSSQAGRV